MYLSHVLIPKHNNFDLFRLVAALMVIYGHAPAFVAGGGNNDFVARLLGFDYSGSLAVKFFFMLSGLLVTNSLLAKPNVGEFIIKRAARIIPGLFVCLCISVFIVGPIFTTLDVFQYFSEKQTWNYLLHNTFLLHLEWFLPGVFSDSKHGVNGSLWTLPLEFACYFFLAAFYGLGIWRAKFLANGILLAVMFMSFVMPQLLPPLFASNKESNLLPGCFALGALLATNKNVILINAQVLMALGLLTALLWSTGLKLPIFYVFFFYACLYFGSTKFFIEKLKVAADPSYGVYIYGFLIQQSLAHLFPEKGVLFNQVGSAIVAIVIGVMSWFLIEKPSIQFTKKILTARSV